MPNGCTSRARQLSSAGSLRGRTSGIETTQRVRNEEENPFWIFRETSLAGFALDSATSSVASGEPPALQCRTPSRHHLELQDRRDYTPADRAARTCWLAVPGSCTIWRPETQKTQLSPVPWLRPLPPRPHLTSPKTTAVPGDKGGHQVFARCPRKEPEDDLGLGDRSSIRLPSSLCEPGGQDRENDEWSPNTDTSFYVFTVRAIMAYRHLQAMAAGRGRLFSNDHLALKQRSDLECWVEQGNGEVKWLTDRGSSGVSRHSQ
ncbi:hypothetical protein TNCV_1792831 [Trichonephila clavipes]|nr:hypothetical protein TNCV_1792831 [Trichonephila clavipes]